MSVLEAAASTASASRYLQQLCKHWSHKFAVEFTPTEGRIVFSAGSCSLQAHGERLVMRVEAADEASAARLAAVVVDHLQRFAFREDLGDISWLPVRQEEGA